MTLERAQAFELPFGMFEGRTLATVAKNRQGRHYLRWLIDQEWLTSNICAAVRMVLDSKSPATKAASLRGKRHRGDDLPKKTDPTSTGSVKPSSRKSKAQHSTKRPPKGEARC